MFLKLLDLGATLIDAFEKDSRKKRSEKYILESTNSNLKISSQYLVLYHFSQYCFIREVLCSFTDLVG
jgi:hypothetical protein